MIKQTVKMNEVISASFTAKFELVFVSTQENVFSQRIHFKANRKSIGFLKSSIRYFQNSSLLERLACLHVKITANFDRFQYFNFTTDLPYNDFFFSKNWSTIIYLKVLRLKKPHFHAKLPCQKPMLKQIEWGVQNGAITKTRILPVTDLTFHKR